jgi:ribosomal-protein-serine acetyltransferase
MCALAISSSVQLRLLREDDAAELHGLIERERDLLASWLPWAAGQRAEGTLGFIRETRQQVARNDGFQTAIEVEGEIAGMVGFHGVDWLNRSTSIGYWLGAPHQGRGTMTAAVRALTDHALRSWDLNRVAIEAAVENRRSRAIPERLGFREEGVLRESERVGDRYLDGVLYAMLARDWAG